MTSNSRSKRDARERVQATGERYTVARRQTGRPPGRRFAADHCANCLNPLPDEVAALFCSELCGQTAEFVRYLRRVTRDGRINDPDVQYATQVRMAHLVAGGYAKTARHLSTAIRAQVRERDGGRCRYCGKPGDEIDHSAGDSSDLANLQLLCRACHHAKTDRQMIPADQNAKEVVSKIRRRVESDVPAAVRRRAAVAERVRATQEGSSPPTPGQARGSGATPGAYAAASDVPERLKRRGVSRSPRRVAV